MDAGPRTSLRELAALFLRLGTTAFGGPAAHIALLRDEVVDRRRWLTEAEFLDLVGATNLLPGPNSTELVLHVGWRRRRWSGLVVAGLCFIAPAALLTGALAWAYVRWGVLPEARALLYGVEPVIVAIVAHALVSLGRSAVRDVTLAAIGVLAVAATLLGVHELAVLAACGVFLAALRASPSQGAASVSWFAAGATPPLDVAAAAPSTGALFLVFAKIGAVLYGSGYVLLAFLRSEFVERRGWLSETQLLDAVAAGQMTPGPVFSSATFVGYVLDGASGALAATVAIFLPAFLFVACSGFLVPRLRASRAAGAFLDGVNVASLALMASVAAQLSRAAIVDVTTLVLALASAVLLVRRRVNTTWLILAGAGIGLAFGALGWIAR